VVFRMMPSVGWTRWSAAHTHTTRAVGRKQAGVACTLPIAAGVAAEDRELPAGVRPVAVLAVSGDP
jgi:hypothetical protein